MKDKYTVTGIINLSYKLWADEKIRTTKHCGSMILKRILLSGCRHILYNLSTTSQNFSKFLKVLKRGNPLVIFPEGTYFANCMGPGHEGMVRFILSRADDSNTFLPVGIQYQRNSLRTNVNIRIGKPVTTQPTRDARPFLDNMMMEIARLSDLD